MSAGDSPSGEPADRSDGKWLDRVKREERRGEFLAAFDLAERGLAEYPDDVSLRHRAVLALARAGATAEAAKRFEDYGLSGVPDEDVAALGARIAKDDALARRDPERGRRAAHAAGLYDAVFARTGGYYPAINAATLWLVSGDHARARARAASVLKMLAADGKKSYYAEATAGEAHLLCGDEQAATAALGRAAALNHEDYAALAGTRRQLRLVCELLNIDPQLLSKLTGPAVAHFCGHRATAPGETGRFIAEAEATVAHRIAEVLERHAVRYAYGSLASGADIMWAEKLLERGSELHVVLPFARDEFIEHSVAPSGHGWRERFDRCLDAATSVRYATDDAFLGDDVLYRYASELAMGLAMLRARYLDAEVRQFAVWDGLPATGEAGTAVDIATWRRGGHPITLVSPEPVVRVRGRGDRHPSAGPADSDQTPLGERPRRVVRALLFGDVTGFSKLTDEQLPIFASCVLGAFAEVLRQHQEVVWHCNTWGDALYVVLSSAPHAAACALDLQDAMTSIDLRGEGLPSHLALRLGAHLGPVFPTHDPVLDRSAFMGSHVSRTARIEPVTPPGIVYVTEPFAAALVLDAEDRFACDYVGHLPAAKDYGSLRMYRLRRTPNGHSSSERQPLRDVASSSGFAIGPPTLDTLAGGRASE